jgi:hypothetical protein
VESEIGIAFEKEQRLSREHSRRVSILIPLDLDGYLFSGECTGARAAEIRSRLAADFRGWESDDAVFEAQLARVVMALRVDRSGGGAP